MKLILMGNRHFHEETTNYFYKNHASDCNRYDLLTISNKHLCIAISKQKADTDFIYLIKVTLSVSLIFKVRFLHQKETH